jgi:hypothetical protein
VYVPVPAPYKNILRSGEQVARNIGAADWLLVLLLSSQPAAPPPPARSTGRGEFEFDPVAVHKLEFRVGVVGLKAKLPVLNPHIVYKHHGPSSF